MQNTCILEIQIHMKIIKIKIMKISYIDYNNK